MKKYNFNDEKYNKIYMTYNIANKLTYYKLPNANEKRIQNKNE